MGKITKVDGEIVTDVVRVIDTEDGFIRAERYGDSGFIYLNKADVASVDAPIRRQMNNPIDLLKRKIHERDQRVIEQREIEDRHEIATVIKEILSIDPKPDRCHCCGKSYGLQSFPCGLAKIVSSKRVWSATVATIAASAAMAAVFLPLAGRSVAGLQLPGKKRTARIIRLTLVLCDGCVACKKSICKQAKLATIWSFHPWWQKAHECGYNEFIYADELNDWKPT